MLRKLLGQQSMDIVMLLLVSAFASSTVGQGASPIFNVIDHGAVGDGESDDTEGFLRAWKGACSEPRGAPIVLVPSRMTFLLGRVSFQGPCKSAIHVQIDGDIVAPNKVWKHPDMDHWITFTSITDLTIVGSGQIDGRGPIWWKCKQNHRCRSIPDSFAVMSSKNLVLGGLRFKDSPRKHVTIGKTIGAHVTGLTIVAPADSPNTDGLHIQHSEHVEVVDSTIATGDDCISIGTGTYDVNISRITCGPGHGISIGSLGREGSKAAVEQIRVSFCEFYQTFTGVRIKTWQGGSGYAKGITFEHLNFTSVKRPIVIDQYYCAGGGQKCTNQMSAVRVSDVQYVHATGSSNGDLAISLNCSTSVPCTNIMMDNVRIEPVGSKAEASSFCINARGTKKDPVIPEVPCLD